MKKYGYRLNGGSGGVPVIDLDVSSYEHKRYGTVFKPLFTVVKWLDENDLMKEAAAPSSEKLLDDTVPF